MLRMLYIHTWADTSAVGPGIWTQMNAQLLNELFARTQDALMHAPVTDSIDNTNNANGSESDRRLTAQRERLKRRLLQSDGGELSAAENVQESVQEHIEAMPAAYLFNTQPEAMALHLAMLNTLSNAGETGPVIDLRPIPDTSQMALTIVTWDDPGPGLLAKITGVLYAFDITLYSAQVFSRTYATRHAALDTLIIDFRDQLLSRTMRTDLTNALTQVLNGTLSIEEIQTRKRREKAHRGTTKSLRVTPSPSFVLLDVEVLRGTGTFFALCQMLTENHWNIETARIAAWSGNLRCAFYLTDAQKLTDIQKKSPEFLPGTRAQSLYAILS
jgi:[protein-PII] uridylyltransferase